MRVYFFTSFDTFMIILTCLVILGFIFRISLSNTFDKIGMKFYQKHYADGKYPWKTIIGATSVLFFIAWIYGLITN